MMSCLVQQTVQWQRIIIRILFVSCCYSCLRCQQQESVVNGFSSIIHYPQQQQKTKRISFTLKTIATITTRTNYCAVNKNNYQQVSIEAAIRQRRRRRRQQQQVSTLLMQALNNNNSNNSNNDIVKSDTTTTTTTTATANNTNKFEYALLFDCDGVIVETEELHRIAYNRAFEYFHLQINNQPVYWSTDYYDILQNTIGGGKQKMMYHFHTTMNGEFPSYTTTTKSSSLLSSQDNDDDTDTIQLINHPPPINNKVEQNMLIDMIQTYKTQVFQQLVEIEAQPRPGILQLMDEAFNDPFIAVGVCSASTKVAAQKTILSCLGANRVSQLNICLLGDDVNRKKPDPLIYTTACTKLGLVPYQCIVIEDSIVGLRAAVAADMKCIITYTSSTSTCDFYSEGAVAVVPDLLSRNVTLASIFDPLRKQQQLQQQQQQQQSQQNGDDNDKNGVVITCDILAGKKDPIIKK